MKIFLSGETSFKANEPFRRLLMEMNKTLKSFIEADENDDTYGAEFRSIGIITMILSEDLNNTPERKFINRKKKEADIRLKIDYNKFVNSDTNIQLLLYLKNIIESIQVVDDNKKEDFNGEKLIEDILSMFGFTMDKLLYVLEKEHN